MRLLSKFGVLGKRENTNDRLREMESRSDIRFNFTKGHCRNRPAAPPIATGVVYMKAKSRSTNEGFDSRARFRASIELVLYVFYY